MAEKITNRGAMPIPSTASSVSEPVAHEPEAGHGVVGQPIDVLNKVTGSQKEPDSNVKVIMPSEGIQVMATRAGFFQGQRLVEGDIFNIAHMGQLGAWMLLIDDKLEAKRQAEARAKKMKERGGL